MFEPLTGKVDFPSAEGEILSFWKERDVFARSIEQRRAGGRRFVFFEGPPTANGLPHPGHALTRAMKDIFPRYRTMCGDLVERKAGWDTHGLPVETEVSKELGIHTKAEIEAFGIEAFVKRCIQSVFRYTDEWREMTERLAFWVDLDDAYATYHRSYVESVWWSLKTLFDRGLLYQGHKVVWWWPQGGTALSAGEVGEGYREVDDPSVYVRFPLLDEPADSPLAGASLLVWTTTPWTLISNHFAAVHPDLSYAVVREPASGERLVIAAELVAGIASMAGVALEVEHTLLGADLVGRRYTPPFDGYFDRLGGTTAPLAAGGDASIGWRVLAAGFVTLDSGTGLVHEAPAFGEVDFDLLQAERARFADPGAVPLLCAVAPDGTLTEEAGAEYAGRYIKDADRDIIAALRERGLLFHRASVRHDYPFCPRAPEDPLIQYARSSWFVRTSAFVTEFLANNAEVTWLPEHIKEGRFGDFLRNNVDWALSRERFWGTPLPIWRCEATGRMEAVDSYGALLAKPGVSGTEVWAAAKAADPDLHDDLMVHKPYIDALAYDSPFAPGARMRRVTEVIDCWWDAGSMPFAQWGFPHAPGSRERLAELYPADFISEAIDQTRGWFNGLLTINTLLFGASSTPQSRAGARQATAPHPFRTCIVLGFMLGEDGLKMSKRTRNYRDPAYIFDTLGADAMRWYFFSVQPPWTTVRFQEAAIRDAQRDFLLRLWNVVSFFTIYARLDGFAPWSGGSGVMAGSVDGAGGGTGWRPVAERGQLDRWIVSELHRTIGTVRASMDAFENYPAAGALRAFVDALSNWYVRRSRDRFWGPKDQAKWDAYNTLYEVLSTLSRLLAPFTPFMAERIHRALVAGPAERAGRTDVPDSVHLCDYPAVDAGLVDGPLSEAMELVRQLVSLGHAARSEAGVRVRQPLDRAEVALGLPELTDRLAPYAELIGEELNVKRVELVRDADAWVRYAIKPNFKALGPRFGKGVPRIAEALRGVDAAAARRALVEDGALALTVKGEIGETVTLTVEDVEIRLEAREGFAAAQGRAGVVVLATELTEALLEEGLVREVIHHVQAARKSADLPYEARIALWLDAPEAVRGVVDRNAELVMRECLVVRFDDVAGDGAVIQDVEIDGVAVRLAVAVVEGAEEVVGS